MCAHACVGVCVCGRVHVHVCLGGRVCACMCVCAHACVCISVSVYECVCVSQTLLPAAPPHTHTSWRTLDNSGLKHFVPLVCTEGSALTHLADQSRKP